MKKRNLNSIIIYVITISIIGFATFILFDSMGSWFIIVPIILFLVFFSFFYYIAKSLQRTSNSLKSKRVCKHCQSEIADDVEICPNCGADQSEK